MQTPFPGIDPYWEQRGLWERIHTRLIVAMTDALNPLVVVPRTALHHVMLVSPQPLSTRLASPHLLGWVL